MVRYKNRYFVTEYEFAKESNCNVISKAYILRQIESYIQQIHGDFGVGSVGYGLDVKYMNPHTQTLIIRARHGPHKLVGSVLPLIQTPFTVRTLSVKATILQAYLFLRNHQIKELEKFWKRKVITPANLSGKDLKLLSGLKDFEFFTKLLNAPN